MPNHFAYFVLFSWPVVAFFLFRAMPRTEAMIWTMIGGYLLLPNGVGIKFPMLPAIDKTLVPPLSAGIMCLIFPALPGATRRPGSRRAAARPVTVTAVTSAPADRASAYTRQRAPNSVRPTAAAIASASPSAPTLERPQRVLLFDLLLALLLFTPVITALHNGEPVKIGDNLRVLPGLRLYDAGSMIMHQLVDLLPYLLARRYLADPENHVVLLRVLCISGLLYTLPTLFEVRMSPQLSRWIYGFLAQPFNQAMRDGGWRPVVFLHHGLWLAIFLAMVALSCVALWRQKLAQNIPSRWLLAGAYVAAVLVLCHSLGALAILLLIGPVLLLGSIRLQLIVAATVALSVQIYPMLRSANLVPVNAVYQFVNSSVGAKRAQSFDFRITNENVLLARAELKPVAGWGGWGRSRIYDAQGRDISTTDSMWIIVIGVTGWMGYIGEFGLLGMPILLLLLRRRKLGLSLATSGLCLILAANLIDMMMNATLTSVTWLIVGALSGRCGIRAVPKADEPAARGTALPGQRSGLAVARTARGARVRPNSADMRM